MMTTKTKGVLPKPSSPSHIKSKSKPGPSAFLLVCTVYIEDVNPSILHCPNVTTRTKANSQVNPFYFILQYWKYIELKWKYLTDLVLVKGQTEAESGSIYDGKVRSESEHENLSLILFQKTKLCFVIWYYNTLDIGFYKTRNLIRTGHMWRPPLSLAWVISLLREQIL